MASDIETILEQADSSSEELVKQLEEKSAFLRTARNKFEKRWWICDRFIAGNHFDVFRPATNEIGQITFPKSVQVRPIHLAIRSVEGIINNLLASDPQWKVFPKKSDISDDEAEKEKQLNITKKVADYFDNLWDVEGMRTKALNTIYDSLVYNFGMFEIYWENGKPSIRSIDPYDILFDPQVKNIKDSKWIIKEVVISLDEVKNNEDYTEARKELKADSKIASSSFKEMRLNEMFGNAHGVEEKALVREIWKKSLDTGWDTYHVSQKKLLYSAHYNIKRAPFISYSPMCRTLLHTSWLERLIPLNRTIDLTLAQIESWVRTTAVGRMKRKLGTKVERILNQSGEFIDIDGPLDSIEWLPVPEIGATPFNYLNTIESLMTTIGATTVSVGKIPKGARAGYKLVESLKASEMSSIQHAVRLFEDFLENTAEIVLMMIGLFGDTPIPVISSSGNNFEIMGGEFSGAFPNVIPASDLDFGVDVRIESGLAYTPEGKRETAKELFSLGLIPAEVALEFIGLGGDVYDIAKRGLEEFKERKQKEKEASGETPKTLMDSPDWNKIPDEEKMNILQTILSQRNLTPQ